MEEEQQKKHPHARTHATPLSRQGGPYAGPLCDFSVCEATIPPSSYSSSTSVLPTPSSYWNQLPGRSSPANPSSWHGIRASPSEPGKMHRRAPLHIPGPFLDTYLIPTDLITGFYPTISSSLGMFLFLSMPFDDVPALTWEKYGVREKENVHTPAGQPRAASNIRGTLKCCFTAPHGSTNWLPCRSSMLMAECLS